MVSRKVRTPFGDWWWTVDKPIMAALFGLMLGGIILSLAASPPVAARLNLDAFHFVHRHILFLAPALAVLLVTSFLSTRYLRRVALVVFLVSLVLCALTPIFGAEIKGARRWLVILGVNVQPSEFVKPAFVILIAWLFAESTRRPEMPANTAALALLVVVVAMLVLQPDFGQTMLIAAVWGALFFMAGMRVIWVAGLAGIAGVGLVGAYFTVPHVARRIQRFLDPASGDTFNIDIALESFSRGGWFGRGPGEGTVKRILPESHTDFVFAVAAEEFGIVLCLMLLALFAFIVIRSLMHAMRNEDPFIRFATAGLAILFGIQSSINMAVNLHLMPAKGMTLPFVSYGGSSMLSLAYGMGMLLALTRDRPQAELLARRDYAIAGSPA
ncbi:MAG: putative lipid II flippase FtsW [Alphaproteobacteria bacterium]|nr:putative lipid II flippase FtsW [Alphaproteobacteria bacterium]